MKRVVIPTDAGSALTDADRQAVVDEASRLIRAGLPANARRQFLRRGLTFGGLTLLSGCSLTDQPAVESVLRRISSFNDQVQGWLFDPRQLAPTYPASAITRPFPFNAFYGEDEIPAIDGTRWQLELAGRIRDRAPWTLAALAELPQAEQITRHICVEGWSAIGRWGGVAFGDFLRRIGADVQARYVSFSCGDDYRTSIDMASALHPQTLLVTSWDGGPLPPRYGFPVKVRLPTKLGYKNPKHVMAIEVTNTFPGGYWEDQGYNWFGGS